jgi:hypothetical protein
MISPVFLMIGAGSFLRYYKYNEIILSSLCVLLCACVHVSVCFTFLFCVFCFCCWFMLVFCCCWYKLDISDKMIFQKGNKRIKCSIHYLIFILTDVIVCNIYVLRSVDELKKSTTVHVLFFQSSFYVHYTNTHVKKFFFSLLMPFS